MTGTVFNFDRIVSITCVVREPDSHDLKVVQR